MGGFREGALMIWPLEEGVLLSELFEASENGGFGQRKGEITPPPKDGGGVVLAGNLVR